MDLGSLFSGFGSPPPNDPPPANYNSIIIIAIVVGIILFFGNTPLNGRTPGFTGPMYPSPGPDGGRSCRYDRYEYSPYPGQGMPGFRGNPWVIVIAVVILAFILLPRRSPVPPV